MARYERRSKCADIFSASLFFYFLSSDSFGSDLNGTGTRSLVSHRMSSSTPSFHSLRTSKSRSRKSLFLRTGRPARIHISRRHLRISRPDRHGTEVQHPSVHVCARSRNMQPQHLIYPVRHDLGLQLNRLTDTQPQGLVAQGHLMTTETQDEDLRHSAAPKMNKPLTIPLRTIPRMDYKVYR